MSDKSDSEALITQTGVREYFHECITGAVERQRHDIMPETIIYLTNLLTEFTHTENLYDQHADGSTIRPLVMIYADALEASSPEELNQYLKRLGDLSLFISGLFSYSLNRSLVDVDYYVAMGGNAYSYLASNSRSINARAFSDIYHELADKFVTAIDILTEVGDQMNNKNNRDIMRLYEIWQRTGSRLAAERLRREGIDPVSSGGLRH